MNIEEIRAEISTAYLTTHRMKRWLFENGVEDADSMSTAESAPIIARMFADRAYEAGLKRGGEISLSALNDVELRGNPIYQKGYEAGKADGQKSGVLFNAAKQAGFDEAAKDPNAWYAVDKNGERIGVDDKTSDGKTVSSLGIKRNPATLELRPYVIYAQGHWDWADSCEKVIPDTREKIKEELASAIWSDWFECGMDKANNPDDLAEQFISRIEALVD